MMKGFAIGLILGLCGCAIFGKANPLEIAYLKIKERGGALKQRDHEKLQEIDQELKELAKRYSDLFLSGLKSKDESTRVTSAAVLGYLREKKVIAPLVGALSDPNSLVRRNAVGSLGMLGFEETPIEKLIPLLEDKDTEVMDATLFALSKILPYAEREDIYKKIKGFLTAQDPNLRNHALLLADKVGKKKDLLSLCIRISLSEKEPILRENSALILGRLKDRSANPYLIELLKDVDPAVVRAAAYALSKINGKPFGRSYIKWREWYEEIEKEKALPQEQKK
jgi:HEAT repeat protein